MILGMGIRGSVAEPQLGLRRDLNLHRAGDDQLGHAGGDAPQTCFGILHRSGRRDGNGAGCGGKCPRGGIIGVIGAKGERGTI